MPGDASHPADDTASGDVSAAPDPAAVEVDAPDAKQEVPYGLGDQDWTDDRWQALLEGLVTSGLVNWQEVASLTLGALNPPQAGTAIASNESFQTNFQPVDGESLMSTVIAWLEGESGGCADCGTRLSLEGDHIEPRQHHGAAADRVDNLTLRCRRHNTGKRESHVNAGRTFQTTESALMWVLIGLRPRTYRDFCRLCRLYGLSQGDVRFQEAWAMAHWLRKDPAIAYDIDDDRDLYDLLRWNDDGFTRRRSSKDEAPSGAEVVASSLRADSFLCFVSTSPADPLTGRYYEVQVNTLPFTYDLSPLPPSAVCVNYSRQGGQARLYASPPRRLQGEEPLLVDYTVRRKEEVVTLSAAGRSRTMTGGVSIGGRSLPAFAIDARDVRLATRLAPA